MRIFYIALLASLVVVALPATVLAGAAIDWDPIFTWEAGATATGSPVGGELKGVGIVSSFDIPFQDLNAADPDTEYTIYIHGLISLGTDTTGTPAYTFYTTNYSGGTIEIYKGTPRNAVFDPNPPNANVPSTFTDGTLILSGSFTSFYTQTNNFTQYMTGNMEGSIDWTGGSLFDRTFNTGGEPCPGLFTGGVTWNPDVLIDGYIFRHDGKIDLNCPTPTEKSTWGRIKTQFDNN